MILVLTGQERFPFDRLLSMVDEGVGRGVIPRPVLVQTGSSRLGLRNVEGPAFLPPAQLDEALAAADIVITHAGVGSVVMSLGAGKVPILVPRLAALKEHVDDHQIEFASRMEEQGRVLVARDADDLYAKVRNYPELVAKLASPGGRPDRESLREVLAGIIARITAAKND